MGKNKTERDAAHLESARLEQELGEALLDNDKLRDQLARMMDLRILERSISTRRISVQRRELQRLNVAIRSSNFRREEMERRAESARKMPHMYAATIETLQQEIVRLTAEAEHKPWWRR